MHRRPISLKSKDIQDNLGVKKVSAPWKNPSKCPIMCFAREKKKISRTLRISGILIFKKYVMSFRDRFCNLNYICDSSTLSIPRIWLYMRSSLTSPFFFAPLKNWQLNRGLTTAVLYSSPAGTPFFKLYPVQYGLPVE